MKKVLNIFEDKYKHERNRALLFIFSLAFGLVSFMTAIMLLIDQAMHAETNDSWYAVILLSVLFWAATAQFGVIIKQLTSRVDKYYYVYRLFKHFNDNDVSEKHIREKQYEIIPFV